MQIAKRYSLLVCALYATIIFVDNAETAALDHDINGSLN